ncbi:glycosyltransferase family 4 protein [Mucilaginibacter robiniae]|uniref:Glycosyltransferase family 4 protein n=1 Tax=Mucilaginibacter robiniae TaxID=2728022 RepID=A0A7L5DW04_9SPHI|nr:glycosyltransferase family 4 protein [Mucilaginibacter robiniae]QJD94408.1 glycosyltransferase family 4 protein [Mucilaginibacter robiniae]
MKKVLLSAFACDPTQGSEPGNGWNWATGLAKQGLEVHCFTRIEGKANIEKVNVPDNLFFHYVQLPFGAEKLYAKSQASMYLYYIMWQWFAYKAAKALHTQMAFDIAHHVTWGSVQLGSFMYKLPVPFVFGPAGGGQQSPVSFKKYFESGWGAEEKREKVSAFLMKYNPACKSMLNKASAVWVSNHDTATMVKKISSSPVHYTLDAALPSTFFPSQFQHKVTQPGKLNLLWVGRMMPRKGVLVLLEVMEKLKSYPGITLTIVGDGEQRDSLLKSIEEKGLQNTVFWKGKVPFEHVKGFYADCDVFFFTSLRDSCPAQLIEAMAYGMPVVTLNLHGQGIIVNDETGFRCSCDTPEEAINELNKAILTLYNEPALVTSMSKAANAFALKQTWENKIKHIVQQSYLN